MLAIARSRCRQRRVAILEMDTLARQAVRRLLDGVTAEFVGTGDHGDHASARCRKNFKPVMGDQFDGFLGNAFELRMLGYDAFGGFG